MSGELAGKVALVTGAARGVGRACAVRLAAAGADLLLLDVGVVARLESVHADLGTPADLEHTVVLVRELGARVVTRYVDVRDGAALAAAVEVGCERLGSLDVAVPAAGVVSSAPAWAMSDVQWRTVLDINLTGAWQTAKAVAPVMMRQRSGSIVFLGSTSAYRPVAGQAHLAAAGHGVLGLARAFGAELAPYNVRANSVVADDVAAPVPTGAATGPGTGPAADSDAPGDGATWPADRLPLPGIRAEDVADAVHFLASPRSRCITGTSLVIDLGAGLAG